MNTFAIERRTVGPGRSCLIIGEVAQAHDGSLGTAHAFIDAIAAAGADAVKFQTHIARAESTESEPFRARFSPQDASRYGYWKRIEFTEEQWSGLARHARERGLIFLSSPFSLEAVELLIRIGVPAWKIASGEVTDVVMLERVAATGLPVLLSTGMSPLAEIDTVVAWCGEREVPVCVLQCTSAYPCPAERVGLNVIELFRTRYDCPAGLSDHSGTIYPGLAAAALGVEVLEVHVTLSRHMFGPDVSASITVPELSQLVEGVRFLELARNHPVDKSTIPPDVASLRPLFSKSVVATVDLKAGTILREGHLGVKKPGTGIPASRLAELIGARVRRDVAVDELLAPADVESAGIE